MPLRKCHLQRDIYIYIIILCFCFCSTWWSISFFGTLATSCNPIQIWRSPSDLTAFHKHEQNDECNMWTFHIYLPWFAFTLGHMLKCCYNKLLPSGELTYPIPSHFWTCFSFSPGGICDRFLRVINKIQIQLLTLDMGDVCHHKRVMRFRNVACRFFRRSQQRLALAAWKTKSFGWLSRLVIDVGSRMLLWKGLILGICPEK